jgi:hypothetical protein
MLMGDQITVDYYKGVVINYLRANRTTFVNTEFCLQLNVSTNIGNIAPSGRHWYVDVVAVDFSKKIIYLCEISYPKGVSDLREKLRNWNEHWPEILKALARDAHLPAWPVRPWLFVPDERGSTLIRALDQLLHGPNPQLPVPRIKPLEETAPWLFNAWTRKDEPAKSAWIPVNMRI